MRAKKVLAMILAGAICASALTGCGINKGAAAATMKDQTITMGMANFCCRFQQANIEDYYKSMMGAGQDTDIWSQDMYGNGTTMEDSVKDSVMEQLHEMYTLKAHMDDYKISLTADEKKSITEAAKKFIESNSSETLSEMTADQDTVEELLTLYTIQHKMKAAIEAEADTNVTDKEANERGYSMVTISTVSHQDVDGNTVDYTDDEKAQLKETAGKMVDEIAGDAESLDTVAEKYGYEVKKDAYAADDSALDEDVKKTLDGLKAGEVSGLIETDNALYIVRLDSETDKEATEKNKETIIEQRKTDHYNEVLEKWQKKDNWKVKEKNIEKISFKNSLTQKDPNASTETEASTEAETSTEVSTQ